MHLVDIVVRCLVFKLDTVLWMDYYISVLLGCSDCRLTRVIFENQVRAPKLKKKSSQR